MFAIFVLPFLICWLIVPCLILKTMKEILKNRPMLLKLTRLLHLILLLILLHRKFITKDSLSLQHKALLIYQKLIAFHLKDAKPDALIDADIQRIQFVKTNQFILIKTSFILMRLIILPINMKICRLQHRPGTW